MYLRQSLDRDQNRLAIDRQREDLLKLCDARGWGAPVEYCDNNVSANTGRRLAYQALCDDIRAGTIDRVAVWDLDRLHRQPAELEVFITLADQHHIELASVGGDADLSTDNGRLFARIKGAVAKSETDRKSARFRRANLQRAQAGKNATWYGQRMFGYDENELVAHEADAIRNAYLALLNGASLGGIAKQWNEEGLRPLRAKAWTGATVRQLLKRERNAGLQVYQGEILEGVKTSSPAIIERDVWDAACAVLADPKRRTGPETVGRKYLLSGLVVCGECGQPMSTVVHSARNRFRYACKRAGCMRILRSITPVDEYVVGRITRRLADPDAVVALTRPTVDTAPLRDQIAALRAQRAQAQADYDEGLVDARRMNARIDRVDEKLAPLEEKLLGANTSRTLDGLVGHADAAARFEALPLDRKRAVIATLARVTINRSKALQGSHKFDPSAVVIEWIS
jgi:site-specific DNA recombinase